MSFQNANRVVQIFVDDYGNIGRTYGVFDFVRETSQENNKVTLDPRVFINEPGKLREVRMNYWPVLCDVEGGCDTNICDAGQVLQPKQAMFAITECVASKIFAINVDDIRLVDNGSWDFNGTAMQIIVSMLPELRRVLATDMTAKLYTMAGVHPDGNAEKRVTVTNPTNGIVNPMGKLQIEREYQDAGFSVPNIYGGGEVYNWKEMVAIGGLNAQGQLINRINTNNAWYDDSLSMKMLNDATHGDHILTIAPEVFKYVWFSENAGIFGTDMSGIEQLGTIFARGIGNGFIRGTLVDPETGTPWDLYIRFDECTNQWTVQLKHFWDFFVLPDVACNGQNVNGIMHWRTCPEVIAECPTGVTPSPAVTPTTYSWTPTMADIPNVYSAVIAGYVSQQNQPVETPTIADLAAYMNDNSNITFTVVGNQIRYTGTSAINGQFNGSVDFQFA